MALGNADVNADIQALRSEVSTLKSLLISLRDHVLGELKDKVQSIHDAVTGQLSGPSVPYVPPAEVPPAAPVTPPAAPLTTETSETEPAAGTDNETV